MDLIFFNYEEFCESPNMCIQKLVEKVPILSTVNPNKKIKVKDYQMQGIINQNERQINKLTKNEIDIISKVIGESLELVYFYGYKLI